MNLIKTTILLGVAVCGAGPPLATGQTRSIHTDREGVQEAIRFERAKDAAAARQARLEAGKSAEVKSADAALAAVSEKGGVQAAIHFQRAKDAADARQARLEANRPSLALAAKR